MKGEKEQRVRSRVKGEWESDNLGSGRIGLEFQFMLYKRVLGRGRT